MTKPSLWTLLAAAVLCASAVAQNELFHFDGTVDATSRGSNGNDAKTFLQRFRATRRVAPLRSSSTSSRCRTEALTPETFTVEIRANDPAVPGGAPDIPLPGCSGSGVHGHVPVRERHLCGRVHDHARVPIAVPSADSRR
ncbi:MAG: hypothetical protein U1E76_18740 [Planctomycetota bacterium]